MRKLILLLLALGRLAAFGQTTATPVAPASTPLASVVLPDYTMIGMSYNQFTGYAGLFSALEPESQSIGLLASESVDLVPAKYTNPTTGKTGYLISGSMRFGQHKVIVNTAKPQAATSAFSPSFVLAVGGDAGAASTSTNSSTSASSISVLLPDGVGLI